MSSSPPADCVIFVLLDAFRHDYLERTRFLRGQVARSLVGRLEEPFGFCPRGAYFGGLTPAAQGFTNLMHFDPVRSVFRWTRELAGTGVDDLVRERALGEIVRRAREQLPAFAAAYVDPLEIPLSWLPYFDVSERRAPWDPLVGHRTLFHLLDEWKRPWLQVSWPFEGVSPRPDNASVAGEALRQLRPDHAFAYIHLPDLDALGHRHGPGSDVVRQAIEEADRLCEMITERALELFADPVIVFAGDHGLLPVVRNVDAGAVLQRLGLAYGSDFAYFIDSTMVRCWFFTDEARRRTTAALATTGAGRWVTPDDRARWGIQDLDARNGEAFFLAHPGVAFCPNFFVREGGDPPRGMHGYAPEALDNTAIFIAHRPRARWSGDAGVVNARRLFPSFVRWLGRDPATLTGERPVDETAAVPAGRRWSRAGSDDADRLVSRHLERCVQAIRGRCPRGSAIILTGGFGRGEGTMLAETGPWRPANDYDFLVIGGAAAEVEGLGDQLARELGIDFVDIGVAPVFPVLDPGRQSDYDLRHGSTILWGDPLALDRLPCLTPARIDAFEGAYLLGNRFGGLALALSAAPGGPFARPGFVAHQLAKFFIAIADAWLLGVGDYHARYAVRRRRFAELAAAAGFGPALGREIDAAFAYKLEGRPLPHDLDTGVRAAGAALVELGRALQWGTAGSSFEAALECALRARGKPLAGWLAAARENGLLLAAAGEDDPVAAKLAIYHACATLVLGRMERILPDDQRWCEALGPCWAPAARFRGAASVAATWLALFH